MTSPAFTGWLSPTCTSATVPAMRGATVTLSDWR